MKTHIPMVQIEHEVFLINLYRNISHFLPIFILIILFGVEFPQKIIPYLVSESMISMQS